MKRGEKHDGKRGNQVRFVKGDVRVVEATQTIFKRTKTEYQENGDRVGGGMGVVPPEGKLKNYIKLSWRENTTP